MTRNAILLGLAALAAAAAAAFPASALVRGKPVHGLALYGEPKYGPEFAHFESVNPDAPKGGLLRIPGFGTFDSFNPFVNKGNPAGGLNYLGSGTFFYFFEPLMVRSPDEPSASYCLICETVEVAEDNAWIEYTIRPEARFHDGAPVTADDVVFSFETLMEKGAPVYRFYWEGVERAEKTGERSVRFWFKVKDNAELPMIMGELLVLSRAFWSARDFENSTLDIPVATGPYRIAAFEPGRYVAYERDPGYWGKDLAVTRGAHNFDRFRIEYFRDTDVSFEAFKAYQFDIHVENSSTRWATGYDEALIDADLMVKDAFSDGQPDSVQTFVMNLRRGKFADARVREALALAFDFDWTNKTMAHGLYAPMTSYFGGSELAATGLPQGEELEILEKHRSRLPADLFTSPYAPPRTDGSGNNRENLLKARALLAAAGWAPKNGALINAATGEAFEIEFLVRQQELERWINPYLQNLARLGIRGAIRLVDTTQYINRLTSYDFDMFIGGPQQSLSPGNEQREYWGSESADRPGGRNFSGIKDPVVDAIIAALVAAPTRESLVAHTRALDRVLLWNHYMVPELSRPDIWWAYWNKFGHPETAALHGPNLSTWWFDAAKAGTVEATRRQAGN